MQTLINVPINEAISQLSGEYETVVIGNGTTVISQYPAYGDDVYTGQKVFLTTNSAYITCPDFTGWSRKELIAYWKELPRWKRRWNVIKICRSVEELKSAC